MAICFYVLVEVHDDLLSTVSDTFAKSVKGGKLIRYYGLINGKHYGKLGYVGSSLEHIARKRADEQGGIVVRVPMEDLSPSSDEIKQTVEQGNIL